MHVAVAADHASTRENPARQQAKRWRTAFENSAIGISMADFSGRFFAANSAFLNLLGYTESELYQLTFIDVTFEDDRERNRELVRELVSGTRQHFEIEKRYRRKDGTLVWARVNAALVPGSGGAEPFWFGIVEDTTQRKHVEGELTAELTAMTRLHGFSTHLLAISEFQPLLEEILDDTIFLQNADFGNILRYNPDVRALEMVVQRGFPQDVLEHVRTVHDIGAVGGRAMKLRRRLIIEDVETDPEFAQHRHFAAFAGFRSVQCTPLFNRSGEFLGILSTHFRRPHRLSLRDSRFTDLYARHAADVIERKRLETVRRQVEEQAEQMRAAQEEAQQALQMTQVELARVSRITMMGELAASIAHEVNQPLTAVTNNANACLRLLADRNLEPAVLRQALEEIVADGTRASVVIARIRALIKKAPAERNELDVNDIIQEVVVLTGRELDENRVLLERQLTKPLPLVLADRVQLQQVLLNLIMNGIEAMTVVTDRPRTLCLESRIDERGNILVAVSDSGTGLGLGTDRVFTPFVTTKANGMGMGLPISRSLVEGHGGRLWATANSPHGTVFSFTLPVADGSPS